jgi:hypothetical protein
MAQYLDRNGALQPVLLQEVFVRLLAGGGTTEDFKTVLADCHCDKKMFFYGVIKRTARIILGKC